MDKELLIKKIMQEIYSFGGKELYQYVEYAHLHIFFVVEEKIMDATQLEVILNELTSPAYDLLVKEKTGFKFTVKGREYVNEHFKPQKFKWSPTISQYDPQHPISNPIHEEKPETPSISCTTHNSAFNSINIFQPSHSTTQIGGNGAVMTQTVSYSQDDWKKLEAFAQLIINNIDKLELDADSKEKALDCAKVLESTAKSGDNKKQNLALVLLNELHVITQHALGHAVAMGAIKVAPGLIEWVKTFLC